jgi:antitoxin MazE
MKSQIRKLGNSHGLIVPKPLLDEVGIKPGDTVELRVSKKGRLVISPLRDRPRAGWAAESRALAQAGEPVPAQPGQRDPEFKW